MSVLRGMKPEHGQLRLSMLSITTPNAKIKRMSINGCMCFFGR